MENIQFVYADGHNAFLWAKNSIPIEKIKMLAPNATGLMCGELLLDDDEGNYTLENGKIYTIITSNIKPTLIDQTLASLKLDDSNEVSRFWRNLSNVTTVPEGLSLHHPNTFFMGERHISQTMYIRKCYLELWEIFKSNSRLLITGNPGIGKSYFLYYVLYQLKSKVNVTIVYQALSFYEAWLFKGDGSVFRGKLSDFRTYLDKEDTYYLLDAVEPLAVPAKTLLVTSSRLSTFKKLPGTLVFYMPVWNEKEMEKCRAYCFAHHSKKEVINRMSEWGGIPRYVLEKVDEPSQSELKRAINCVNLEELRTFVGRSEDLSHKVVHLIVNEKYTDYMVMYASKYVADQVSERLGFHDRLKLAAFLKSSESMGVFESMRGQIFESYAHHALITGGSFQTRALETSHKEKLTIPPSQTKQLYELNDVATLSDGEYGRPMVRNWPAVDSIVVNTAAKTVLLFQITISNYHPIKTRLLTKLIATFPDGTKFKLLFVMPQENTPTFSVQSYINKDGTKTSSQSIPTNIKKHVVQYALIIPL